MNRITAAVLIVTAAALAIWVGSSAHAGTAAGTGTAGGSAGATCARSSFSPEPLALAKHQAESLLKRMTLDQKVTLMHGVGQDQAPSGTVGATAAIPSLGIPAINQQDGPGGIGDGASGVTQLPAPEVLAATFDPSAAACYGQVVGTEARDKGINLIYGPTVNIVRVPLWGRAFESLGEDPDLTGTLAASEVDGIQGTGTMAQVKHYAVYNQETNRNTPEDDAIVSTKALQEIYLRAWDLIVHADPSSIMCSYSTINGAGACQDSALINGYLDTTLGFSGFVSSDYFATHSTVAAVDAGLDQEQPASTYLGSALVAAVKDRQVSRTTVDDAALRVLTQMYRFRLFTNDTKGRIRDDVATAADTQVSNSVAEEGSVLLKNADHTLPLAKNEPGGIAIIGPTAQADPISVGGGSATVTASHVVTPLAGIRAAVRAQTRITYTPGLPATRDFVTIPSTYLSAPYPTPGSPLLLSATLTAPQTGTYELAYSEPAYYVPVTLSLDGTPVAVNPGTPPRSTYTATVQLTAGQTYTLSGPVQRLTWVTPSQIDDDIFQAVVAAKRASAVVVVVGDGQESEASDRLNLTLPSDQDALVDAVAAANRHTVVVIDAGGPVTMPWLGEVPSILDAWYPGQTDGTALAAVLFGGVDPSGHLPVTFPTASTNSPVSSPTQFPGTDGTVGYSEGVDVGYRWYDSTGTVPLFPFGYGLSYTTFRYRDPKVRVRMRDGRPLVTATVRVTNTGDRSGADIAQLYLGQPSVAGNPPRQLDAFRRLSLTPGTSQTVSYTLGDEQLAYYDTNSATWRVASGTYRIWMGDSSALEQLPATVDFRLARTATRPVSP
jgi:beta-glucosidase